MSKYWESIYSSDFVTVYNPFFIKDMSKALERTVKAINEREKIVIYGACNVDSICSVSLLLLVLKYLNADVEYYIPNTTEHNYRINSEVLKNHINFLGASVIITVGCEMESDDQLEYCNELGIDIIIMNTTKSQQELDTIIVNPNQRGCLYKFKDMSNVGLSFKLTQAISMYYDMKSIDKYIDIVMLGTIAAKVPLVDENYMWVTEGLKYLLKSNNYGIKALIKIHNIFNVDSDTAMNLILAVTPTANAIGKMDNARIAVELFTTSDALRAEQIAKYLYNEVTNNLSSNFVAK